MGMQIHLVKYHVDCPKKSQQRSQKTRKRFYRTNIRSKVPIFKGIAEVLEEDTIAKNRRLEAIHLLKKLYELPKTQPEEKQTYYLEITIKKQKKSSKQNSIVQLQTLNLLWMKNLIVISNLASRYKCSQMHYSYVISCFFCSLVALKINILCYHVQCDLLFTSLESSQNY